MIDRRKALVLILASALTPTLACGTTVKRPDGGAGLLPVGSVAPDVTAEDAKGQPVHLSDYRGKPVVVYFYPADDTPGCTKEACAFRDVWKKFEKADVIVIGVSSNDAEKHRAFRKKHNLPFPLAADVDGTAGKAYGVPKTVFGYDRVTFLVAGDGRVAKVWPEVDPGVHAEEVLKAASVRDVH